MSTTQAPQTTVTPQMESAEQEIATLTPEQGADPKPPCQSAAPKGFEEFDLDDIEVIESKVFA